MSEREIDESGRNPTQQRMDEEGVEDVPVAREPDSAHRGSDEQSEDV